MPSLPLRLIAHLVLPLALAACGSAPDSAAGITLDDELAQGADTPDPLLAAAVQDPILSDPMLSIRSNADAIRPPSQPYAAPVPADTLLPEAEKTDDGALTKAPDADPQACRQCAVAGDAITLAALAARLGDARMRSCAPALRYAAGWATRLPADLPLHRAAHVTEAAGADTAGCHLRAVTLRVQRPVTHMLDWYFTQASKAGYAGTHHADDTRHVLAGTRAGDGSSYVAVLQQAEGGATEIDLLVRSGR